MTRRRRPPWILWSALSLSGCGCIRVVDPEHIDQIAARHAPVAFARKQATVVIESANFSGEFVGVLLARARPLAVRLQLFPEIGGKILDVVATRDRQTGVMPMDGGVLEYPGGASNTLLEMFATSILEAHAPIERDRITCSALTAGAVRLELRPRFGESQCTLVAEDDVRSYDLERGGASWQLRLRGNREIEITADGFKLTARIEESESLERIPDEQFELRAR